MSIKVLHIDTGTSWRGGQNQLALLLQGLQTQAVTSYVVLPRAAKHAPAFAPYAAELLPLPLRGLAQLHSAYRVSQFCQKRGIQLLHAHSSAAHTFALLLAYFGCKAPLIVHRRVIFPPGPGWLHRYKYGPSVVSGFIAVSAAAKAALCAYGIAAAAIAVIPSAVPAQPPRAGSKPHSKEALAKRYAVPTTRLFLGFCAALTPEKGLTVALEALAQLARTEQNWHFFIAGTGAEKKDAEALCARLGLASQVTFCGHLQDTDAFLQALDIFLFPSLSEGLGTTLLQAAYQTSCVIATNVGGIPEVIQDGKTGLLVPSHNPLALSAALLRLWDDQGLRASYAQKLWEHVHKNFSLDELAPKTVEVYKKFIN